MAALGKAAAALEEEHLYTVDFDEDERKALRYTFFTDKPALSRSTSTKTSSPKETTPARRPSPPLPRPSMRLSSSLRRWSKMRFRSSIRMIDRRSWKIWARAFRHRAPRDGGL